MARGHRRHWRLQFHATKNITCGEGGALLVNNKAHVARAEILCDKGTNRSEFFRGEARKYDWRDVGVSGPPSDIAAAALLAQLQAGERVTEKRARLFKLYQALLEPLEAAGVCRLPVIPEHCQSNHHIFYILTADANERSRMIEHLKSANITAYFHYVPLHMSDFGAALHNNARDLPHTVAAGTRLLRLPMYFDLTETDVTRVASAIYDFYGIAFAENESQRAAVR